MPSTTLPRWLTLLTLITLLTAIIAPAQIRVRGGGGVVLNVDITEDDPTATACTPEPGDCSLRGAIHKANSNPDVQYEIHLQPEAYWYDVFVEPIVPDTDLVGDLDIKADMEIYGHGAQLVHMWEVHTAKLYMEDVALTDLQFDEVEGTIRVSEGGELRLSRASWLQETEGYGMFVEGKATLVNVFGSEKFFGLIVSGPTAVVDVFHSMLWWMKTLNSGKLRIQNSVVFLCYGALESLGGNFVYYNPDYNEQGCIISGNKDLDIYGSDPGLGLTIYENQVYIPPFDNSVLVNAVDCIPQVTNDQLGNPRPADNTGGSSTRCDIGPIELQPNKLPIAGDDYITTMINRPIKFLDYFLKNNDNDPDPHSFGPIVTISSTSAKGGSITREGNSNTYWYTPPEDFFGEDTFTYTLLDERDGQATGTVHVTVEKHKVYIPTVHQ